jgi:hypothetical protein
MKISDIKEGQVIELDDGFTCMKGRRTVFRDEDGLYVWCEHGHHYLKTEEDEVVIGVAA